MTRVTPAPAGTPPQREACPSDSGRPTEGRLSTWRSAGDAHGAHDVRRRREQRMGGLSDMPSRGSCRDNQHGLHPGARTLVLHRRPQLCGNLSRRAPLLAAIGAAPFRAAAWIGAARRMCRLRDGCRHSRRRASESGGLTVANCVRHTRAAEALVSASRLARSVAGGRGQSDETWLLNMWASKLGFKHRAATHPCAAEDGCATPSPGASPGLSGFPAPCGFGRTAYTGQTLARTGGVFPRAHVPPQVRVDRVNPSL